jgi:hypothetical protein
MAAFIPGESPPEVRKAIFFIEAEITKIKKTFSYLYGIKQTKHL